MTGTIKAGGNTGGEGKGGITKFMKKSIIIKVPIKKVLDKARKLYYRSFSGCAGQISYAAAYGSVGAYPAPQLGAMTAINMQRSFSSGSSNMDYSSDNDLRELIKAASIRQKKESSSEILPIGKRPASLGTNGVPRSRSSSVAIIGRIDEDSPSEFGSEEAIMVKMKREFYPRSRTYAAAAAIPPNRRVSYSS